MRTNKFKDEIKSHLRFNDLVKPIIDRYNNCNIDKVGNLIIKYNDLVLKFEFKQNRVCIFKRRDYICFDINNVTFDIISEMLDNNFILYSQRCLNYRIGTITNSKRKEFFNIINRILEENIIIKEYKICLGFIELENLYIRYNGNNIDILPISELYTGKGYKSKLKINFKLNHDNLDDVINHIKSHN